VIVVWRLWFPQSVSSHLLTGFDFMGNCPLRLGKRSRPTGERNNVMARLVHCVKLRRELPGLDRPPFPGPLGERIYREISRDAWQMWLEYQTIVINHYGLNPADPDDRAILRAHLEAFLFGSEEELPEEWIPPGAGQPGKGAPARKK
jgi:Fe-S cluster biosynthesis and repair protein YggX